MIVNRNTFGMAQIKFKEDDFVECFESNEPMTAREIELSVLCSRHTVKKKLELLVEKGIIKKKKTDVGWIYWKTLK